jgi:hypothetical protein
MSSRPWKESLRRLQNPPRPIFGMSSSCGSPCAGRLHTKGWSIAASRRNHSGRHSDLPRTGAWHWGRRVRNRGNFARLNNQRKFAVQRCASDRCVRPAMLARPGGAVPPPHGRQARQRLAQTGRCRQIVHFAGQTRHQSCGQEPSPRRIAKVSSPPQRQTPVFGIPHAALRLVQSVRPV